MKSEITEIEFRRKLLALSAQLAEIQEQIVENPENPVDANPLIKDLNNFYSTFSNSIQLLKLLQSCADIDDFIFVHSIKVTLLCQIIGKNNRFSNSSLYELMLCALFHDIGKITLSEDTLYKKEVLNEAEMNGMMGHAEAGYNLLIRTNLPSFVADCAKHHHERWNGSGYPDAIAGESIPFYARYVAIADVVDAMTSNRPYRDAICPFNVVEILDRNGYISFDPNAYIPFLTTLTQSFIGAEVQLSNGLTGKVILLGKNASKPVVQVQNTFIDCEKYPSIRIVKILN